MNPIDQMNYARECSTARYNIKESKSLIRRLNKDIRNKKDEIIYQAKNSATLGLDLIELERKLSSAEITLSNEEKILAEIENEK